MAVELRPRPVGQQHYYENLVVQPYALNHRVVQAREPDDKGRWKLPYEEVGLGPVETKEDRGVHQFEPLFTLRYDVTLSGPTTFPGAHSVLNNIWIPRAPDGAYTAEEEERRDALMIEQQIAWLGFNRDAVTLDVPPDGTRRYNTVTGSVIRAGLATHTGLSEPLRTPALVRFTVPTRTVASKFFKENGNKRVTLVPTEYKPGAAMSKAFVDFVEGFRVPGDTDKLIDHQNEARDDPMNDERRAARKLREAVTQIFFLGATFALVANSDDEGKAVASADKDIIPDLDGDIFDIPGERPDVLDRSTSLANGFTGDRGNVIFKQMEARISKNRAIRNAVKALTDAMAYYHMEEARMVRGVVFQSAQAGKNTQVPILL